MQYSRRTEAISSPFAIFGLFEIAPVHSLEVSVKTAVRKDPFRKDQRLCRRDIHSASFSLQAVDHLQYPWTSFVLHNTVVSKVLSVQFDGPIDRLRIVLAKKTDKGRVNAEEPAQRRTAGEMRSHLESALRAGVDNGQSEEAVAQALIRQFGAAALGRCRQSLPLGWEAVCSKFAIALRVWRRTKVDGPDRYRKWD